MNLLGCLVEVPRWWAEGDGLEDCPTPSVMDRREGAAPGDAAETLRACLQLCPLRPPHHPTVIVPRRHPSSHHINVVTMGPSSVINSVSTSGKIWTPSCRYLGLGRGQCLGLPLGTGPLGEIRKWGSAGDGDRDIEC